MIALICIILGILLVAKSFAKTNDKEKGFVLLLGGTLLMIWFFPGAALLIVGVVMLMLFGFGGGIN